uniref:non-specific serine/threonine protein kinase n=1 Tax=Plectus sambesii TaxID=2011161 RepID=A0A914V428_9BILA
MYVFQLPFHEIKALSDILDAGNSWEELASAMPQIAAEDVNACRQAPSRHTSPTEELLRIWGTKGYSVLQLYKVLAKVKHVRAMKVIRHLVEEKYHRLESDEAGQSARNQANASFASPSCDGAAHRRPSVPSVAASIGSSTKRSVAQSTAASLVQTGASAASSAASSAMLSGLQNTPTVRFEELLDATDRFAATNMVGRGGYGVVYKGYWKHTHVAVKRIQARGDSSVEQEKERLRQSLMELRTLAMYRHDNVLPLYGYSLDGPEPCLVYQFMAGGSLEDRLLCRNGTAALTWTQRLNIANGTSKGLHFLHTIGAQPLIHGDVKSANILLDKHFEPKLGDFGLCRVGQIEVGIEASPLVASHIKGTLAYLPPEFITSKHLSTKLDVYSFGVVMLEVATGLRAYSDRRQPHSIVDFILEARRKVSIGASDEQQSSLVDLADKKAGGDDALRPIFWRLLNVGLLCSDREPTARPVFGQIIAQLD